jgi:hypothetical protein
MISKGVIAELEARKMRYILGARLRSDQEVREEVLLHQGVFQKVDEHLFVKEVSIGKHRYVVCRNPDEAVKDAADREAIVKALEDRIRQGPKSMVGNRGFRKYLSVKRGAVQIDRDKIQEEARFDGMFVLRTNTSLPAQEVALQYKRLWRVERLFRTSKSILETRPIFHHWDSTISGHVFCSFLALVLLHELECRISAKGWKLEWYDIQRDLEALQVVDVSEGKQIHRLRTELVGVCGKVCQAAGVAIPPPVLT